MTPNNITVRVARRFWLTTLDMKEAKEAVGRRTNQPSDVLTLEESENDRTWTDCLFNPNKLGHVYQFSKRVLQRSTKSLIICVSPTPASITRAALLLGGYLIVCEGVAPELVAEAFQPLRLIPFFEEREDQAEALTVEDCWAALHRAKSEGWLDFSDAPAAGAIDMEEHLHYDSVANGELHVVVPDKLLALPSPSELPDGLAWHDEGGARRFSAAYYGDILADFDVTVAVCCAGADGDLPYDPAALGVAVEVLAADAREGCLLAASDRLLTLARAAPGALALHGTGAWEEGLLLSTYLIRLHGFPAREALAWVRMAHPSRPVAAPVLALHACAAERRPG